MNKEVEINKELIKVLKEKIQLLEEQKANSQEVINAQKEQLILSGVSKALPDGDDIWEEASNNSKDNFVDWYDNL